MKKFTTATLKKLAEAGDPAAMVALGAQLAMNKKGPIDWAAIIELWTRAAELGHQSAMYNLGLLYRDGPEELIDLKAAFGWFKKAARNSEDAELLVNLAFCYAEGIGTRKNMKKAVEVVTRAAELGDPVAQCNLGLSLLYGDGAPEDAAKAVEWFEKAARQKFSGGQFQLGEIYLEGNGVPADRAKGLRLIRQAAAQGRPEALCRLGLCYHEGEGVKQDFAQAVEWYRKAAAAGDGWAMYLLGLSYLDGEGVKASRATALRWFEKANLMGIEDAHTTIHELTGTPCEH